MMLTLIERIRERLVQGAYVNEAAISHGIVTPILNALGWDSADPQQLVPEFSIGSGRVDFALFGLGHRPAVFVEVKAVGRAAESDRQLFRYAFDEGVPLCVLTDGREWSFYLPSGHGSFEDRRIYRLQLDDRAPEECERILHRYLGRERVRDGVAFEDAQRDHRDARGRREAKAALPRAWTSLIQDGEELLIDLVSSKAEALCGYRPAAAEVLAYLGGFSAGTSMPAIPRATTVIDQPASSPPAAPSSSRELSFTLFGHRRTVPTARDALVEVLSELAKRQPEKVQELADAVKTRTRNHVARTAEQIYPARPDLARAAEFAPEWLVGLNLSNREKMGIIRAAVSVFGLNVPADLDLQLPNA